MKERLTIDIDTDTSSVSVGFHRVDDSEGPAREKVVRRLSDAIVKLYGIKPYSLPTGDTPPPPGPARFFAQFVVGLGWIVGERVTEDSMRIVSSGLQEGRAESAAAELNARES